MKPFVKGIAWLLAAVVVAGAGFYIWASFAASRALSRTVETHRIDLPIPFPLSADELATLELTAEEGAALARERALERGRHLVEARYACVECHGRNFAGGVMVDDALLGRLLGPNITSGLGGRVADYDPADWDRIVRHGVLPDGRPAAMPSDDYERMSDQELSDIIVFLRSQPAVNNQVPPPSLGPLGKVLMATGQLPLSADTMASHDAAHARYPPETAVSVDFGHHLAGVCTGCHREDLSGGPVAGGDPSWPPASNLTPDASGLAGWSYDEFVAAMREGKRPDGTTLREPMTLMEPYAQKMADVELEALWLYLQSVPPVAQP
jgi:mono/diheme cytochrome c family protein